MMVGIEGGVVSGVMNLASPGVATIRGSSRRAANACLLRGNARP